MVHDGQRWRQSESGGDAEKRPVKGVVEGQKPWRVEGQDRHPSRLRDRQTFVVVVAVVVVVVVGGRWVSEIPRSVFD